MLFYLCFYHLRIFTRKLTHLQICFHYSIPFVFIIKQY
uniref:Uncharacterized protein n=1 Tax=Anguilla anguilla TaxID=7936 RepID=A0A0E9TMU4_ANGAN